MSLEIQGGDPPRPGSYVVFTNDELLSRYAKRVMLMWSEGRWWHPLSDQKYRGHVYGWIGPLPAMELVDDDAKVRGMSHKIDGTRFEAEDIGTWLRFEIAIERRELALHKERCLPETARKIRQQAAEDILQSGLFCTVASVEEENHTEKTT